MRILYLLCLWSLLLPPHFACAGTVELREVTKYFGKSQGALKSVRRYETVVGEGDHQHKGAFVARNYGDWSLILETDAIGLDPAETYSVLPLELPEEEILGADGLLFICLDRFLADVPRAGVDGVQIELRSSPKLWAGFLERGQACFREKKGPMKDSKAVDRELGGILIDFLEHSAEAKALGERIAAKLGRSLYMIRTEGELWELHNNTKSGGKLSEIATDSSLGYTKPPMINYRFK